MFQLSYELRPFIAEQYDVLRPPACSVLPPHCTNDVYIPQESTRDLWTILQFKNLSNDSVTILWVQSNSRRTESIVVKETLLRYFTTVCSIRFP
jgi:hypothetical protein